MSSTGATGTAESASQKVAAVGVESAPPPRAAMTSVEPPLEAIAPPGLPILGALSRHPEQVAPRVIRLILADDHPVVLRGLAQMFRLERDFAVVDAVTDGASAIRSVIEHTPDVLVLDVRMPGKDGIAVLRELKRANVPTRVVLLTAVLDEAQLESALAQGADGIAFKDASPRVIVECVRRVASGARWLDLGSYLRGVDHLRMDGKARRR